MKIGMMLIMTIGIVLFNDVTVAQQAPPCNPYTSRPNFFDFCNIELPPRSSLQTYYEFRGQPMIYCYENFFLLDSSIKMSWHYKGEKKTVTLSSIPMIQNSQIYQGELADATGRITIENNSGFRLCVSCVYAFGRNSNNCNRTVL